MGHFGQSEPSTCTCYSPSPPSLVLPRPCRWCTTPPSTSPQTSCLSAFPVSLANKAFKAPSDTAYVAAPVGRVKIQTYRGPSKGEYDFAPWDTTTPSLLTSRSTTRANTNNNAIIHPFHHIPVESIPANKKTRIVVYMVLL